MICFSFSHLTWILKKQINETDVQLNVTEESKNIEVYLRFIHFENPFTLQKIKTLVYSFLN